jgi:hypothetical protein
MPFDIAQTLKAVEDALQETSRALQQMQLVLQGSVAPMHQELLNAMLETMATASALGACLALSLSSTSDLVAPQALRATPLNSVAAVAQVVGATPADLVAPTPEPQAAVAQVLATAASSQPAAPQIVRAATSAFTSVPASQLQTSAPKSPTATDLTPVPFRRAPKNTSDLEPQHGFVVPVSASGAPCIVPNALHSARIQSLLDMLSDNGIEVIKKEPLHPLLHIHAFRWGAEIRTKMAQTLFSHSQTPEKGIMSLRKWLLDLGMTSAGGRSGSQYEWRVFDLERYKKHATRLCEHGKKARCAPIATVFVDASSSEVTSQVYVDKRAVEVVLARRAKDDGAAAEERPAKRPCV